MFERRTYMLKLVLLTLTSAVFALGSTNCFANTNKVKEEKDAHIIVQLASSTRGRTFESVKSEQDSFLSTLSTTITSNFTLTDRVTNVGNIVMLDVPSKYVDDIRKIDMVKNIDYNTMHAISYDDGAINIKRAVHDEETDNASAETMNKPTGTKEGEGVLVAILDNSFLLGHEVFSPLADGVETKLKAGDVATIASSHEEFTAKPTAEHTTYYNNKVPFYFDYGGSTNVRGSAGTPDYDVLDEDESHGTHVASIAAGNGPTFKGIAPKAQLALMKVFTEYTPNAADAALGYVASSGAYDDAVILALEDAALLGADIVSCSFGSDLNDFDENSIIVDLINDLTENGIFVNIAAGNSGKGMYDRTGYENWTTDTVEAGILGGYAAVESATTVAAGQPNWQFYETALVVAGTNVSYSDQVTNYNTADGAVEFETQRYLSDLTKDGTTQFDWVKVPGWGESADYDKVSSVNGKIAVVDRGEISFTEKVTYAVEKGAIAVIIINNDASETDFTFRMDFSDYQPPVPVVSVLFRDKEVFDSNKSGRLDIVVNSIADNPTAKQISTFSSDGATYDLDLKPEITTPGENIRGAVNTGTSDYEYYSGTSMATPNYSGVQALLLSEHLGDADYRADLVARTMSTAEPMKDVKGENYTSVRIQGAGMVDLTRAVESTVYLEDTANSGKAKIALGNNEDIKKGDLKLSFLAHNASGKDLTYTATTYIYRPDLDEMSLENYPELTGKYQKITNHLIAKVSQTVTVAKGTSTITLNTWTLSGSEKTEIDQYFTNGCFIEGYVVLTGTDAPQVNLPFLGFYGDYAKQVPVEEFSFEKEEGKVYGSDVVNSLGRQGLGLTETDFGSGWVMGYWEKMEDISIETMLLNETNIFKLKDGNKNTVKLAGTDPLTGLVDPNNLIFGNNGATNTMIIQQFVNRACTTNEITLKNKATGEVVLVDHMFDSLFGQGDEDIDGNPQTPNYALYKSIASADYLASGIIAHRAYTIIPMYDTDTLELFPDGEYEMTFSYDVAATNGKYEKKYNLTLDSEAPTISQIDEVRKGKETYIRVTYEKTNLSYAAINGTRYEISTDANGRKYIDIPQSEYSKVNQTVYVKSYNTAFAEGYLITNAFDESYHLGIANNVLLMTHTMSYTVADASSAGKGVNKVFEVAVKKGTRKISLEGDIVITVKLVDGFSASSLEVYTIDADGKETKVDVTTDGYYATFKVTETLKFRMTSEVGELPPAYISDKAPSKGGCGGSLIASSVIVMSISITLLAFVIFRRKRFVNR